MSILNLEEIQNLAERKNKLSEASNVYQELNRLSENLADDLNLAEIEVLLDLIIMPFFKYVLTRNDLEDHYDSNFCTDVLSHIIKDVRSQGLSDANSLYFLFLGYMHALESGEHSNKMA